MTSEQAMLTLAVMAVALGLTGCVKPRPGDDQLARGVYPQRQIWAVAPLRNESGSDQVNGARVADHLARQIEITPGIDVVPVNRVLAAMQALNMTGIRSPQDAEAIRRTLGVDALVVGTVSDYDPYSPPKLGMSVELYVDESQPWFAEVFDLRRISRAPTDEWSRPPATQPTQRQPITVVSGFFDAANPGVRNELQAYASHRGANPKDKNYWRQYYLSMDLYTEFVTQKVRSRLIQAELERLAQQYRTEQPAS